MKKVIVIGAGPAGLSCAYELTKKSHEVRVFEASEYVGGMGRSFDLWGQRVDLGPHRFFSKQKNINTFFKELIGGDFTVVNRQSRIFYNERFFAYPLKLGNVLKNLSPVVILQILWYYSLQKVFPNKNPKNFEEWVINRFGKKLYEIFFKNYTEKLWGIECAKIDAEWAAQRIKTLSLYGAVVSAMVGNGENKHKTLVDQFSYPKNGTGTLYQRAAEAINNNKGKVLLSTPVKRVILDEPNNKVKGVELVNGSIIEADIVVSTMPLNFLMKGFEN
nr:FAD-dependent oxidoreductase [Bacteroidota bacterium]